mgnify:CR=1 FL=1
MCNDTLTDDEWLDDVLARAFVMMLGVNMPSKESLEFTYNFAEETNTEMVNFYSAMAYPGSPLHLEARKNKISLVFSGIRHFKH